MVNKRWTYYGAVRDGDEYFIFVFAVVVMTHTSFNLKDVDFTGFYSIYMYNSYHVFSM